MISSVSWMFKLRFFRRKPRKYVWRNKDYDIPVIFVGSAGSLDGIEFAKVIYNERTSFVPMSELFYE